MQLALLEGFLSGEQVIKLNRPIAHGDYSVIISVLDSEENYNEIIPSFPIIQYEDRVVLNLNNDFSLLQLKIEVTKVSTKRAPGHVEKECNECSGLVDNWTR